jgi:flagellar biosynthesis/type III secretory pathway chaperone
MNTQEKYEQIIKQDIELSKQMLESLENWLNELSLENLTITDLERVKEIKQSLVLTFEYTKKDRQQMQRNPLLLAKNKLADLQDLIDEIGGE